MLAEWTAECAADAPTLVVPWSDAESGLRFVDLRSDPYALAEIGEAELFPELGRALRSLNAQRSPLLTAKCDAWELKRPEHAAELDALALELDLDTADAACSFACYIDCLWRDRALFASAHQQQLVLDRITRRMERLRYPQCAVACVLRPALLDLAGTLEGYAFTLYLRSVADTPDTARVEWGRALDDITVVLRERSIAFSPQSSATIDSADAYPLRVRNVMQDAPEAAGDLPADAGLKQGE
jgi:hypothetical protein